MSGKFARKREAFREIYADEQRTDEPRRVGDADGIEVVYGELGALECFTHDAYDSFAVAARGDLRHDTAV